MIISGHFDHIGQVGLSDAEKEQVIEALHTKWSDQDNEVVKRMALFKERSPEILKPILES